MIEKVFTQGPDEIGDESEETQTKRPLRDRLGQALQAHSYYKTVRIWAEPTEEQLLKYKATGVSADQFHTTEETKKQWREMADRFLAEMCKDCNLTIT